MNNITMRDIISCPVLLRLGSRLRGPKGAGDQSTVVGTLRRVLLSNITCYNSAAKFGSNITGIPGFPVEDLKISDIYVQHAGGGTAEMASIQVPEKEDAYPEPGMLGPLPAHGFYFRHVNRLEMSHVEVQPKAPDAGPQSIQTMSTVRTFTSLLLHRTRRPSRSTSPQKFGCS